MISKKRALFLWMAVLQVSGLFGTPSGIIVSDVTTYPYATETTPPLVRYEPVLKAMLSAKSTLDVVMYDFSDPLLIETLIAINKSGVVVRVLLNQTFAPFAGGTVAQNNITMATLQAGGVAVEYGNPAFTYTHEKTLIIDSATSHPSALIMTLNFEEITFAAVRDFSVLVTSPADVTEIQNGFNADWDRTSFNPTQPALVWSPNNSLTKLTDLINSAQHTIDVYMELLGDPQITQAFLNAVNRGVVVRMIISAPENSNFFGQYYNFAFWNGSFNANAVNQLQLGGVDFRFVQIPYIHAKAIIVDQGYSTQNAFVGSENLYTGSLEDNRELGILTTDNEVIQAIMDIFEYDWDIFRGF